MFRFHVCFCKSVSIIRGRTTQLPFVTCTQIKMGECGEDLGVSLQDVQEAYRRIRPEARKTPVLVDDEFDRANGRKFYFKAENMQRTGAFKIRGVMNAVRKLQEKDVTIVGLVSHSSGNFGKALAWAARHLGVPCVIACPTTSPKAKFKVIEDLGGQVIMCEPTSQSRMAIVNRVVKEKGYTFIDTSDDYDVIAGQGTLGLELLEQVPEVDAILVPVSGGGMAAGICMAVKSLKPAVKVFTVEPKGKELQRSLEAGERLWKHQGRFMDTVADGMRKEQVCPKPWPVLVNMAEKHVFSVTDDQALRGMTYAYKEMKIVVETAAGTSIAAAMSPELRAMDPDLKHVAVIMCGGNVDLELYFKQLKDYQNNSV